MRANRGVERDSEESATPPPMSGERETGSTGASWEGKALHSPFADTVLELGGLVLKWLGLQAALAKLEARQQLYSALTVLLVGLVGVVLVAAGVVLLDVFLYQVLEKVLGSMWAMLALACGHLGLGVWLIFHTLERIRGEEEG